MARDYVKRWRGKRQMLNPAGYETTAAIVAEIEDTRDWEPGKNGEGLKLVDSWLTAPDYCLQISDCTRSISFNLTFNTAQDRRANLTKVDRMIDALTAFREALVEEQALYAERMRLRDKARATKN